MATSNMTTRHNFYPRPPRGGRLTPTGGAIRMMIFLSTPSARRATPQNHLCHQHCAISIHALREEGDLHRGRESRNGGISIHALREEGDATAKEPDAGGKISIHALREEGDECVGTPCRALQDFYPRPPRGGRPVAPANVLAETYFYPRPPRGGRPPAGV